MQRWFLLMTQPAYSVRMYETEARFDAFLPDGSAGGSSSDGKAVSVFGALPGERARVRVFKKRRGVLFGEIIEVTEASPHRVKPREAHFTSCAPWQCLAYGEQVRYKRRMLGEAYREAAGETRAPERFYDAQSVTGEALSFGYRTKIEFSFMEVEGTLHLAFFRRGTPHQKIPLPDGCALASTSMNTAALAIRDALRTHGVRATQLKTLVVRESKSRNTRVAALYICASSSPLGARGGLEESCAHTGLTGLKLIYSDPQSPAIVATDVLDKWGSEVLEEHVADKTFRYAFDGFFQNNIPLFELALKEIHNATLPAAKLVDLYCGAGVIGISLADRTREVVGIEESENAARLANENAVANGVRNFHAFACADRNLPDDALAGADVVVLDPPRSGLHKNVIALLLQDRPDRVIYLSCNPHTQAQDYAKIRSAYIIKTLVGFDFYPNTPHVESLLVLERT